MIASWIGFATLVTAACGLGAWCVDLIVRDRGRPRRFVWTAAVGTSAMIVLARAAAPWLERLWAAPLPETVVFLDALRIPVAPAAQRVWLDPALLTAWGLGSFLLLLLGVGSWLVLLHRARAWQPTRVRGVDVWVSDRTGPAVVGVLRPRVVLPRWSMEEPSLPVIVAHEQEHVQAGDNRLLAAAHIVLAAVPWNLPLWWIVHRLRTAIEADCDQRVLESGAVDTRQYCELLLDVGGSRRVHLHPMVALSEPRSHLEQRIDQMTSARFSLSKPVVLGLALVGALALGVACSLPGLDGTSPTAPLDATEEVDGAPLPEDLRASPTFTPFTVRPDLVNRTEVSAALIEAYPTELREAGIGGTTSVWFLLDATGAVRETRVQEPSGHAAVDAAALEVARAMKFTPALNAGEPVPVWVAFPITFQSRAPQAAETRDVADPQGDRASRLNDQVTAAVETDNPDFTPYTVAPRIENEETVRAALASEYPPLLRDAGIGGTVSMWFHVDESGVTQNLRINESSGHPALDQAALRVAEKVAFSAALNGDDPVDVWVAFPITFNPNR